MTRYVVGITPTLSVSQTSLPILLWAAGALVLTAFYAAQYVRLRLSVGASYSEADNVCYSSAVSSPVLFGFVAPTILVPANFTSLLTPAQQKLVLQHEQTHYRHGDHLWNTLALCITLVFWFNPLVWISLRAFRCSQEMACDHAVMKSAGEADKLRYATALVSCAEQASLSHHLYAPFGEKSTMLKRLNTIKRPVTTHRLAGAATLLVAALFTVNTALATQPATAAPQAKVNEATPVVRVDPTYPEQAVSDNLEGSVTLRFDITETGATDNIEVVSSDPAGVFDESAQAALAQWQYKPRIQGGQALRQTGLLVQLDFRLGPQAAE
ncbi:TonB family protein [Alteromonas sp. CYL-A6]|uniref:TonB family protein n=1 Tax=Alteromonas nitratireducens TaxID=3390813 RepID=UPI0034A8CBEE